MKYTFGIKPKDSVEKKPICIVPITKDRLSLTNMPDDYFLIDIKGLGLEKVKADALEVKFDDLRVVKADFEDLFKENPDRKEKTNIGNPTEDFCFSDIPGFTPEDERIVRKDILEKATDKPLRDMKQYDVFFKREDFDEVIQPSVDGLALRGGRNYELRNSDTIRLQFPIDTDPLIVLKALERIVDWIKEDIKSGWDKQLRETYSLSKLDSTRSLLGIKKPVISDIF